MSVSTHARKFLFVFLLLPLGFLFRSHSSEVVFAAYNVENYLGDDSGNNRRAPVKSEASIQALLAVIKEINPDILGVCEMGSPEQFEDFKQRLAGLGYTHFEYLQAADTERHLALLSRFPIVSRQSRGNVPFTLNGQPMQVRRGFLDVTVELPSRWRLRLVGAHLKSKLPVPEGEALLRRHEAHLLREHINTILDANPRENLLVYGDLNDTKNEPTFQEISGPRQSPGYMADLWLKDNVGDRWTYYWKSADIYSRIDYILVNRALMPQVDKQKSYVYRSALWDKASDHRPVVAVIRPNRR